MKKPTYFLIISGFYINTALAVATHQNKVLNYSQGLGSPIVTITTETLNKKELGISQRTEYYGTSSLSNASLLENPGSESETGILINFLTISYGLTNDFTLGGSLPFLNGYNFRAAREIEEEPFFAVKNLGNLSGLADANIFGLWNIKRANTNAFQIEAALLFGANIPTGKTNALTTTSELFSASDQPGSGSWEPFGSIVISKKWEKLSLSSNLIYTQTTRGIQDTILGSYLDYYVAAVYPLIENRNAKKLNYSIEGILEIVGEYVENDSVSGIKDPNTGGNVIYLAPGVRVNFGESVSCYLGVGLPISQTLYGVQSKNTFSTYSGIDIVF